MTTVLITGASAGLGAAFARGFAAKGCHLVLVARDKERLEAQAAALADSYGVACEVLVADLLDPVQCRVVEERLADAARPVDMLVNNAGFGLPAPFPYSPVEDEERMLDLLVRVPMRLAHAVVPGLRERRRGAVLNVSSVAGLLPTGTYGAAKAWVTAFSESLRVDLAPYGVRVLAVVPGFTRTEFQERAGMDVSALKESVWLDADDVVARALRDLALRRPLSVTGWRYRAYAQAVRHLPRHLVATRMARTRRPPAGV
ncbi:SDR family oxidoreductase [Streptomyces bambusae]|uniref:SDR family NAD(P)-dependent oxidoreductase n=1 Tax=Streptomyces bambusae TaxID=1550616 RepID=UPI001CFCA1CE|nr:SDR family oxidoreductase [Streptomyces bambusae]MCB5164013.1 SDR family oxidoreductase [Streptomyces bambusae]